ncbi:MAG: acyl-CoA dehydrogenase family protein [Planctomycetota bacterium]|nr:acyl-CoA dehydrogenase family protein [Planctomycetota bacterium]
MDDLYDLSEIQQEIRGLAGQIANEQIRPVAAKYDESQEFPWEIMEILADADLFGVYIDEEYGGLGGGVFELVLVVEQLSMACGGISLGLAGTALGTFPIILDGNDEQKKKYLPDIAAGKKLAAFAVTEPEAGSDASNVKTTAKKVDGGYVLNGTKQWITNGGEAETYTVIAMTDKSRGARGATAFIVEKGWEGFTFGKKEDKLGIRASATRELIFEDCFVPEENVLGKPGRGFFVTLKTFDYSRPGVAAQALGIAQGAFDLAMEYATGRVQFDKPVTANQGLQFMIADMATKIELARSITYTLARAVDAGKRINLAKYSSMAKMYASDVAMEVATNAIQLYGGYGYMKDYPIEKYFRDAKITQIYEGTNQIQRDVIGKEVVKETMQRKR